MGGWITSRDLRTSGNARKKKMYGRGSSQQCLKQNYKFYQTRTEPQSVRAGLTETLIKISLIYELIKR